MNFIKNVLHFMLSMAIISCIAFNCALFAAPDCMDTSRPLSQSVDYKDLHYVACNHDCYKDPNSRLVENRGKCSICGHYHMPRPLVMVKTNDPASVQAPATKAKAKNMLARLFARKNQ
jgi:hypothetical protein